MAKKEFSNLNRGKDKIENALSSFIVEPNADQEEKPDINPLKAKKASKAKALKKKPTRTIARKKQDTSTKAKAAIKQPPVEKPVSKPSASKVIEEKKAEEILQVSSATQESLPNDFKAQSAIYSKGQLDQLRKVVSYRKWKVNPKYSIKIAIYEALEMLLKGRVGVKQYPDDFITYAPLVSESQWGNLNSFIGETRFKGEDKYAIKYALYEALEMFLKANPIDLE